MNSSPTDSDLETIRAAEARGSFAKFLAAIKLTGPGWLQGAVTLGGGSLAGSLYLGVIAGTGLLWVQPLAMLIGVIMLGALAYVTLSTGERPLGLINRNVSPVLGWGWALATFFTTLVWDMPQFNLGRAAIQQNLLPAIGDGTASTIAVCLAMFLVCSVVVWFYDSGASGIRIFERILKVMVAVVVLSFFGVVISLSLSGRLHWSGILSGFIPNLDLLRTPAPAFLPFLEGIGAYRAQWSDFLIDTQRDRIITAMGSAVGVNMTFLLPYTLLRRGWTRSESGLAIFDLSIGLFIPFVLATSCLVIAAASQFHGDAGDILNADGSVNPGMRGIYEETIDQRLGWEHANFKHLPATEQETLRQALPPTEKKVAAMLSSRDTRSLALSLQDFTGPAVAQFVFGIGILGMAISTIVIHMLMAGLALSEMIHRADVRSTRLIGSMICGVCGFAGPFLWTGASRAALAIPTSIVSSAFLPLAYLAFLLLLNSPRTLGTAMPRGGWRWFWNVLMVLATTVTTVGIVWGIRGKAFLGLPVGTIGIRFLAIMFVLGIIGFFRANRRTD
ncbi:MAG: hypothetical protein ABI680_07500 [Chthoniobacteraceae bacterium]